MEGYDRSNWRGGKGSIGYKKGAVYSEDLFLPSVFFFITVTPSISLEIVLSGSFVTSAILVVFFFGRNSISSNKSD